MLKLSGLKFIVGGSAAIVATADASSGMFPSCCSPALWGYVYELANYERLPDSRKARLLA
jgi:hypothetical protein